MEWNKTSNKIVQQKLFQQINSACLAAPAVTSNQVTARTDATMALVKAEANSQSSLLGFSDHGISGLTACLFVVGEITGAALLAMPEAVKSTGWFFGPVLMIATCIISAFCGIILSKCWLILESVDPSLKEIKTRNPYALIGEEACGNFGHYACMSTLIITLFGAGVVQILVCSEMIESLIPVRVSFCQWIMIVGICLLPFSFFGSPVDFSPVAFFAMSSTTVAAILILISLATQESSHGPEVQLDDIESKSPSAMSIMLGLSSMCYAFSGTSCMPTIQNDMRNKKSFKTAITCAYAVMISIYLPVSLLGYYKAGSAVQSNVVRNLTPSTLRTCIEVLMTAHVLCAYLILMNPVNLNIENRIGIRHSMSVWRCLSRSIVTLFAIFTALTVPKFGKLLPIVGASSTLIQTFILPSLFYYRLTTRYDYLPTGRKILLIALIVIGVVAAVFGTISALSDLIAPDALSLPCYLSSCGT